MINKYPRPQFIRENWINLDGEWKFAFDKHRIGEKEGWYRNFPQDNRVINVPYTYETEKSLIGIEDHCQCVWYKKDIELEKRENLTLLNFEGVDYFCKVWINGECAGIHYGAYAPFTIDITDFIEEGNNKIAIMAVDEKSCIQPRGKQRWKNENFGCWYVQTTGIWKTVWIEQILKEHIENVKMTPNVDKEVINIKFFIGGELSEFMHLEADILFNGTLIRSEKTAVSDKEGLLSVKLTNQSRPWALKLWSPENPQLYDVKFRLYSGEKVVDEVQSYFGMRSIVTEDRQVKLNGIPYYQKLILDQGYWQESHLTAPSYEAMEKEIQLIKDAGFNGLRKHQKIEDRRFISLCDKLGLLVWAEMPSQYAFSDKGIVVFTKEWLEIVNSNYNNPSIITWVPFNESWGIQNIKNNTLQQSFTIGIYYLTKAIDSTRPVITNDGWEHTVSDIITLHDYDDDSKAFEKRYKDMEGILANSKPFNKEKYAFADGYIYKGQPIIMSEYGGIAFTSEEGWGYGRQVDTEDEYIKRYEQLTKVIKENDYFCGFCHTQLTDVQQEVNGLYGAKRVEKVDINKIKEINEKQ